MTGTARPDAVDALHHNFVVALLNDLFGIQCRGGCSCAGPYGHRLLGWRHRHQPASPVALRRLCFDADGRLRWFELPPTCLAEPLVAAHGDRNGGS